MRRRPQHPALRRAPFWATTLTVALGTLAAGMVTAALPWAYLSQGGSPGWAGLIAAALHLPVIVGMALGGRAVDRLGPRRVLLQTDFAAALVASLAALVCLTQGDDWLVLTALAALANLAGAPGNVAQDVRLPDLARLGRLSVERANGVREIAMQIGQAGGPALGILLVETTGLTGALVATAGLLGMVALLDLLTFPAFRRRPLPSGAAPSAWGALWAVPMLRAVVPLGVALVAIFSALDEVVAPNLALLGGDGQLLVRFLALSGGSAFAATAAYVAWGQHVTASVLIRVGVWGIAAGCVTLALAPPSVGFAVAPVLIGLGVGPMWPAILSSLHRTVPVAARGRLLGMLYAIVLLSQPVAAAATGPLVGRFGPEPILWGLAAVTCLIALTALVSPGLRRAR